MRFIGARVHRDCIVLLDSSTECIILYVKALHVKLYNGLNNLTAFEFIKALTHYSRRCGFVQKLDASSGVGVGRDPPSLSALARGWRGGNGRTRLLGPVPCTVALYVGLHACTC
ncbi:unnamed protein product [Leptosia nina]|uniref:Uncharacterized protein n=1 Tax=Leptosia nina TaxID=320188 RepID=A0AAV1JAU2_9NEOP